MPPKTKNKGKAPGNDDSLPPKRTKQYKRGTGSNSGSGDTEMSDRPDWTNLPEQQWPENKDPNYGLRFTHPQARENFEILRSKRVIQPKYVHIPTLQSLGILDEVQSLMSSLGI